MKVCVVGCGHWGRNLVRNFHATGSLYGICDADPGIVAALAAEYGQPLVYPDYAAVLADARVQAIVLATPPETHFPMGMQALRAGKDLFVEKPLALRAGDGLRMACLARDLHRILMTGHLLIFHPAIAKIRRMLQAGELGQLEYIYSNRLSMGRIRREVNALWSFAPHDVSVIIDLMGASPIQVSAVGGAYLQPDIADVTVSNLLFADGRRAHIFVSWLHPYKEQRLVIIGSRRMVAFEDSRARDKLLVFDKQVDFVNGTFATAQSSGVAVKLPADEPLRLECEHFLQCVRERRQPATDAFQAVEVLHVLEACQQSIDRNGEPVRLRAAAGRLAAGL